MNFREFKPCDMLAITDVDAHVRAEGEEDVLNWGELHAQHGPCLTLTSKQNTIACGGIFISWPGTAWIWLRLSQSRCGPEAARMLKQQMYQWIAEHHLNRLQATAQAGWAKDQRFLEWLGMKREVLMRKYGPNDLDAFLYAWVRE